KRAELGDRDHRGDKLAADRVIGLELLPGVVLFLLVTERNLLVLGVVALDIHVNAVTNPDNLRRMLDVLPAQRADVAQAGHVADVSKGAVGGQALDNAGIVLADFNILPELFTLDLVLLGCQLVDAAGSRAAGAVGDIQADMLA